MENFLVIVFWLLVSTLSGSIGAIYLKKAMNKMPSFTFKNIATSIDFYIGAFLYIVSAQTNIQLYKHLDYSIGFPMTSIGYIWTILISYFVFKEKITKEKILAIALIVIGIAFLGSAGGVS